MVKRRILALNIPIRIKRICILQNLITGEKNNAKIEFVANVRGSVKLLVQSLGKDIWLVGGSDISQYYLTQV